MNLVQLIKGDKKLRQKIDTTFSRQNRETNFVLLAPLPYIPASANFIYRPGRVGTAFDYLFRLVLRERNQNSAVNGNAWIAESKIVARKLEMDWELNQYKREEILQMLEKSYSWRKTNKGLDCMSLDSMRRFPENPWLKEKQGHLLGKAIGIVGHSLLIRDQWLSNCLQAELSLDKIVNILFDSLKEHRSRIQEYREVVAGARYYGERFVRTGELPDKLPKFLLKMSNLDTLYRSLSANFLPPDPDPAFTESIPEQEIDDLLSLYRAIPKSAFMGDKILLSPDLSLLNRDCRPKPAKPLDGGIKAEADVIIDDLLIDVKTTKSKITPTVPLQDFCQLMGYFALTELSTKHVIKRLGIYYARYGYLYEFPVPRALPNKGGRAGYIEWFRRRVRVPSERVPKYRPPSS